MGTILNVMYPEKQQKPVQAGVGGALSLTSRAAVPSLFSTGLLQSMWICSLQPQHTDPAGRGPHHPGIVLIVQVHQCVWMRTIAGGTDVCIYNGWEVWIGRIKEDEESIWKLESKSEVWKPGASGVQKYNMKTAQHIVWELSSVIRKPDRADRARGCGIGSLSAWIVSKSFKKAK